MAYFDKFAINSTAYDVRDTLYSGSLSVLGYGADPTGATDSTEAIQRCVNDAATMGKAVFIPAGVYICNGVELPSYTYIYGTGVLQCTITNYNALNCKKNQTIGGYSGTIGVTIEGLSFTFAANDCCGISMWHCTDIVIRGCHFYNLTGWHFIELNSAKDCLIEGCTFREYSGSEMVQFDGATSEGVIPGGSPFDGTVCSRCTVSNCIFENTSRETACAGIGWHNPLIRHSDITVVGCTMRDLQYAFRVGGCAGFTAMACIFDDMNMFTEFIAQEGGNLSNFAVIGCKLWFPFAVDLFTYPSSGSYNLTDLRFYGNVCQIYGNFIFNCQGGGTIITGNTLGNLTLNMVDSSTGYLTNNIAGAIVTTGSVIKNGNISDGVIQ